MENAGQIDILLIEDDPLDAEMTIRTLQHNIVNTLHWVKDGQEALDFLFCEGSYENRKGIEPPKLILLDIKLPKVNGIEVLHRIKADEHLRRIQIVIMTSSSEQPDIAEAFRLAVNSYVVKPIDYASFAKTIARIGLYWIVTDRAK